MKVLHTADWHLGKKLDSQERTAEHQLFLDWLIQCIEQHQIDVLIVAGDIFDTAYPNNNALKLYYNFLKQMLQSNCKRTIIIGGNHDSPSTLNAPQDLLKVFNISVLGGLSSDIRDHIIECKDKQDNIKLVICATPFLRDRDLRLSVAGEDIKEREDKVKQGIENHYADYLPYLEQYQQKNIPIIATGHLYMAGSSPSPDSEKDIYVGNLGRIHPSGFPTIFKYVALGHLHRAQNVGKQAHICYSGSPIPLSFAETKSPKYVNIINLSSSEPLIESIEIPLFRNLLRMQGNIFSLQMELRNCTPLNCPLPAWVEIQMETQTYNSAAEETLIQEIKDKPVERLFIKQIQTLKSGSLSENITTERHLNQLSPLKVFEEKCAMEYPDQDISDLKLAFNQILLDLDNQDIENK